MREIIDKLKPFDFPNIPVISVVTIGELHSLALQNNWGTARMSRLERFIKQFLIADINSETVIRKYAEIDAFSQNRLEHRLLGASARNMGKNDLWIAATASVLKANLVTTDKDFCHLDKIYFELININISL